jgi:hypothetical protein
MAFVALAVRPAEAMPPLPPEPEFGAYRFVADVDDAVSVFLNPAAMAGSKGTNLLMDLSGGHHFPDEWSGALQGGWSGFGYRHNKGEECGACGGIKKAATVAQFGGWRTDSFVLAAAQGGRWLRVGVAREWMDTDTDSFDWRTWHASVLSRPSPRLSLGGTIERLDTPRYDHVELRPRYTYGVSLRPLPSSLNLLVLNVQGRHEDGGHGRVDMLYGVGTSTQSGVDAAITLRDVNGAPPEFGLSVTRRVGNGAYTGRVRAVTRGTDDLRGSVTVQAFDEFWRRSHPRSASEGAPRGQDR